MKTRFPLLPLLALVAAVLACSGPSISGGDYPTIKSLVVTPPSGSGPFTATIILSPYKQNSYIRCNTMYPSDQSEEVYRSVKLTPYTSETNISFDFTTVAEPGNYSLFCWVSDDNSLPHDTETTPFTVTGEVTATPTPEAIPAILKFLPETSAYTQKPDVDRIMAGGYSVETLPIGMAHTLCWSNDGRIRLTIVPTAELVGECLSAGASDTIHVVLLGEYVILTGDVKFTLVETRYIGTGTFIRRTWEGTGYVSDEPEMMKGTATWTYLCEAIVPQICALNLKEPTEYLQTLEASGTVEWEISPGQ